MVKTKVELGIDRHILGFICLCDLKKQNTQEIMLELPSRQPEHGL